jgi:hypothetical protein
MTSVTRLLKKNRPLYFSEYFKLELAGDKDILIKRLEYENEQLKARVKWLEKGTRQYNRLYWEMCSFIGQENPKK